MLPPSGGESVNYPMQPTHTSDVDDVHHIDVA